MKNTQFLKKQLQQQNQHEKIKEEQETKRILSPKQVKKNYLKISPNHTKKETIQVKTTKQKNVRASTDERLLMTRLENENFQNDSKQESFFSEINPVQTPAQSQFLTIKPANIKKFEEFSDSENNLMQNCHQRISQDSESIIFDKVYFFSSRLSAGFASLFSIQKINMKSKTNEQFVIEVVIKAYEQIVVQKIVYNKNKRNEVLRRIKPVSGKDEEKEKLKNELLSELIVKTQIAKNRESIPESIQLTSQKQNLVRDSQGDVCTQVNRQSVWGPKSDLPHQSVPQKSRQSPSSMNFSKVSPSCYQKIIEYIEKYCQLEVSYLGAFLKESDEPIVALNQLMRKKDSNMQQTLLQSLNLAKILYFLIRINKTYYTAKAVILGNKRIKYFLLYEFSNLIRHEKHCIIEQEESVSEEMGKMRKNELVRYLYKQMNRFFMKTVMNRWSNPNLISSPIVKTNQLIHRIAQGKGLKNRINGGNGILNRVGENEKLDKRTKGNKNKLSNSLPPQSNYHHNLSSNIPLINALQLCFGTIRQMGFACDINSQSQRLFKIVQNNYRNDIRWQKPELIYGRNQKYQNFFLFHHAFDYELVPRENKDSIKEHRLDSIKEARVLFASSFAETAQFKERLIHTSQFSYTITRKFQIAITLYPSAIKSKHQLIRLHPTRLRLTRLQDHFRKQQFLLLHIIESLSTCFILNSFLKKQYIRSLAEQIRQSTTPFFTTLKNKKYYVQVYVPFLQGPHPWKGNHHNLMKEPVYIQLESRISVKRYSLKMSMQDVFESLKEYYRLCSDSRAYLKFMDAVKRVRKQMSSLPKEFFVQKLKFYVSKLYLMRKNTYSQFYFIPLSDLISEASHKASMTDHPKTFSNLLLAEPSHHSSSFRASQKHTNLILQALQKLQCSLKQEEKSSRSTISKIRIKNFPVYQIYYKTTRRLIPGYFIIVSIYYMPMFDLSEIKLYLTKMHKSFFVSISKNIDSSHYENIVIALVEYLKDKFFGEMMAREAEKLSSKYKDFYSRMIRQAESPFISKTRKIKETPNQRVSMHSSNRKHRHMKRNYALNEVEFVEMTEQLLCKVFQSVRHNKYLIRLSYPSTEEYISEEQRKGIDELISISILKQNCMIIFKFQTTARKLLSKKVTHKFNVVQLEYQEKNKPFYILFEEIKILIQDSDQSTYGLLNTFRSYFLNKHHNIVTNNNLVSMFSINLFAGLSKNFLATDTNLLTINKLNQPYHFDTQKDINLKDLNSSLYQRYCLFIHGNQILQVLKIRKKAKIKAINQTDNKINSGQQSETKPKDMKRSKTIERKKDKKQSIEAFLPSIDLLSSINSSKTPNIRMNPPQKTITNFNKSQSPTIKPKSPVIKSKSPKPALSSPKKPNKIDFLIEDTHYLSSKSSNDSQRPNLEEKLVYLINTDTEFVTEIQSSLEDHGFTINVPFGSYNKKMFRRLFKNLIKKVDDYELGFIKADDSLGESGTAVKSLQNFSLLY